MPGHVEPCVAAKWGAIIGRQSRPGDLLPRLPSGHPGVTAAVQRVRRGAVRGLPDVAEPRRSHTDPRKAARHTGPPTIQGEVSGSGHPPAPAITAAGQRRVPILARPCGTRRPAEGRFNQAVTRASEGRRLSVHPLGHRASGRVASSPLRPRSLGGPCGGCHIRPIVTRRCGPGRDGRSRVRPGRRPGRVHGWSCSARTLRSAVDRSPQAVRCCSFRQVTRCQQADSGCISQVTDSHLTVRDAHGS